MIDRLMGALPSTSGGTSDLAWLLVWQSTLWLAVGLLAARVWRRRAGRAHMLLVLAMGAAFISPLLTVIVHRMQWGFLPAPPEPPPVFVTRTEAPELAAAVHHPIDQRPRDGAESPEEFAQSDLESIPGRSTSPIEPEVATSEPPAREQSQDAAMTDTASETPPAPVTWTSRVTALLPAMLAAAWSIASFLLMIRLAISLLAGTRIVRTSREETNSQLVAAIGEATRALGLRSAPSLRASPHIRCPMIWCWGARPVVLLPATATDAAPILWRSVFCHELAHAIRSDHWTALWAEIVVIALPWQPLAWLSRRRLAYLREQACDDWVLSTGGEATNYAHSLLQLVPQGKPAHALAAVSSRESLKRRLEHVLSGVRITPKVGRHWLAAATLLALAAIAGVGFAQQGKRATAPSAEPAPQLEVAEETKPAVPPAPAPSPPAQTAPGPEPSVAAATPPSTNVVAAPPPAKASAPTTVREIHGRVLLPSGRPAVGATVRAMTSAGNPFSWPQFEAKLLGTFSTNAEGNFEGQIIAPVETRPARGARAVGGRRTPVVGVDVNLWATLPGYGLALVPLDSAERNAPIVMKLADEETIRGRLLDLEARPIRDAKVEVLSYVDTTSSDVDQSVASVLATEKDYRYTLPLTNQSRQFASASVFLSVKTDADGRFALKGIGRDREVELRIFAPQKTATIAWVLTRPIKPIPLRFHEIFGSQFERVIPPSVPVEGFVTDEQTGKPISGVRILQFAVNNINGLWAYLSATTDARGHYRIEGLDTGATNEFSILISNLPYFSGMQFEIAPAKSLEPIRKNIKLRHGVWAVGRAYDRATGKPVSGRITYKPFQSNEFARKFPGDALFRRSDSGSVDADGNFRAVVIPGRGALCLQCSAGDYRFDFGKSEIKEFARSTPSRRKTRDSDFLRSDEFHSVRAVDVASDAEEVHVDLPVDPGQNVVLKFADAAGKSLAGVDTYGLRFPDPGFRIGRGQAFAPGDSAVLYATYPGEARRIWLKHRKSGLTKLFDFTTRVGETERTVVLEPPAIVTGHLISAEGTPLARAPLHTVNVLPGWQWPEGLATGADGRFRIDFPPGGPYTLQSQWTELARNLTVEAGEQVDLGDITIEARSNRRMDPQVHRGPEKRTKMQPAAKTVTQSSAGPSLAPAAPMADAPTTIRGTVLRPDGKPARDATVAVYQWKESRRWERVASTQSDARGKFELGRPASDEVGFFLATAEGLGFDCRRRVDAEHSQPLVMQLVADEPIRGRVLDLEGHPVVGARVHVVLITDSRSRSLGPWLAALKSGTPRYNAAAHALLGPILSVGLANNSWDTTIPGVQDSTTTDGDGRFTFRGLGAERVIDLAITSDTTAYRRVTVATRIMPPIVRAASSGDFGLELFGAEFTTAAKPTRPVVGTVRDAKTGKPLEGVGIESWQLAGEFFAPQRGVRTRSDSQGRYRLVGLPKGNGNVIRVIPNDDQPYFMRRLDVPETPGIEPVTVDIELTRGLWISGRVIDKDTGKPVRAHLNYWPFLDNRFAKDRPGFGPGREMVADQYRWPTRADGAFRIPGLPGRGVVGAEADLSYRQGAGAAEIRDADRKGELRTYRDWRGPSLKYPATMKEINPSERTETVVCDLVCDHGETVKVTVLDPEGNPARHCSLSKLTKDGKLNDVDSPFELHGLSLNVPNTLFVEHKERKLAKVVTFTLTEGSPRSLTVKLEPCATVIGRLLDEDGLPINGVTVEPLLRGGEVNWVQFPSAMCQENGSFECRGLPAEASFSFLIHGTATKFLQGFGSVATKAGKTIDLGDIRIQRRGTPKTDFIKLQKPAPPAKKLAANETKPKAAAASDATSANAAKNGDGQWLIRGTVLRPDGKPAAGAQVLAIRRYWSNRVSWQPMATARVAANGEFEIHVPRTGYDGLGSGLLGLAARVDGFGIEWARGSFFYGKEPSSPVVLRLVPESPIHGRVVDLEGRPMSGVSVRVVSQAAPKEGQDLGPWLDAVKKGDVNASLASRLPGYEDETSPPIVSDRDGRFTVTGIGAERMVRLQVSGETIASEQFEVVTRSMNPLGPAGPSYDPTQVFGNDFTYRAAPTKPIVGTVRDAVTGKPLAGVHLQLSRHDFIGTRTDAEGKFRLVGMPKETVPGDKQWNGNRLIAMPNLDQPYFGSEVDIPQTAGLDPVTLDIKLKRGLWITGRVTDKVTGKPVSAVVRYFPYGSNPFMNIDEWRTVERNKDESHRVTRLDGTYRIVGLPWRAIVGVRAGGGMYLKGVGASEIPEMDKKGRFPKTLGSADAGFEHALKEINPLPGTESVACDLAVDPGGKVRITFVDGAGMPVEDTFLLYLTPGIAVAAARPDSTFEIAGLAPKESRTYQITQWQRKIAKVFTLEYDEKASQTLTVQLEPCATVRGRLLDEEGSPLKNVQVFASAMRNGREEFTLYPFGPVTDADGHFAIENLAAGCDSYKIRAFDPKLDFVTVAEKVSFAPGKTIDLGEIKLQRQR
jgi:beta-lactamase regulating signal transducer with metallopeptidase domain